jgi:hypothetical protein
MAWGRAMTYRILVADEWWNMIAKVEAGDLAMAHEVVEWIVENRKDGDDVGIRPEARPPPARCL